MSVPGPGLFHRLVQQASGLREPRLHAPARLPFHAPPTLLEASPEVAPALQDMRAHPAQTADRSTVADAAWMTRPHTVQNPSPSDEGTQHQTASTITSEVPASIASLKPDLIPELPTSLFETPSHPHASARRTPVAQPVAAAKRARAEPSITGTSVTPEQAPYANADPATPAEAATRTRAQLHPTLSPSQPSASQRNTLSSPERPAANEIHIHIGRIEVTATQETAAPKRREHSGPAPLSLNDYLERRARGGA